MTSLPVQQRRRIRLDPATETAGLRAEPIIELLLLGRCLTAARALLDRIGVGHPFGAIEPMPMPVQVNALGPHR